MRNKQQKRSAGATPVEREVAGGRDCLPRRQRLRGVAGQLRPYPDVRAGFAPWRRLALVAWAARDDRATIH